MAPLIWERLGSVPNYVEPFAGSCAVLLARPHPPGAETVNDTNGYLSNFWRAVKHDPERVAQEADYPVSERDLSARHYWLVRDGAARLAAIEGDPDAYDARVAGWWLWGACAWIGRGWCEGTGPWQWADGWSKRGPGQGINRQLPHLGDRGMGINRQLPHLGDRGQGINRQLPHLSDRGRGGYILATILELSARLRDVRISQGDWQRCLTPGVTCRLGVTGVLLDPPYGDGDNVYGGDMRHLAQAAAEWAIAHGDNPMYRIAYCGYAGTFEFPPSWECVKGQATRGYAKNENRHRERVWFSPHVQPPEGLGL